MARLTKEQLNTMTANQAIAALGWHTEPGGWLYWKRILRADGSLVVDGPVKDAWVAIRREARHG